MAGIVKDGAPIPSSSLKLSSTTLLRAKSSKKNRRGGSAAVTKGFGAPVASSAGKKGSADVQVDKSKTARAFYEYLESKGAGDNLQRTALGFFSIPLPGKTDKTISLRGLVALKDIKKGDAILDLPYEVAINLGPEGGDPTGPAIDFLRDYCETMKSWQGDAADRGAYYEMLPKFQSFDCLGSTDFFDERALEALQSPLIAEETVQRRAQTEARFNTVIKPAQAGDDNENNPSFPPWIDGFNVTLEHLKWAVWLITSRVLTVQGAPEDSRSYRLLIPYLDMCNHDRKSPHVLTGRAMPGGRLKVVAGVNVRAGDQINICYGAGVAGNDRFIQDYGFLDDSDEAYQLVAQQLLGKIRIQEGANVGKFLPEEDREKALQALRATTMAEDKDALERASGGDDNSSMAVLSATDYRLRLKQALSKYILVP